VVTHLQEVEADLLGPLGVADELARPALLGHQGGADVGHTIPYPFSAASQFVRPEDVAASIPCGPDLDKIAEAVSKFWEAGFTDIGLVQVGDEGQDRFLAEAAGPLLERLRAAAPQ
jgi:hypothetical protein